MLSVFMCDVCGFSRLNDCILGSRVLSVLAQAASKLVLWRGSLEQLQLVGGLEG